MPIIYYVLAQCLSGLLSSPAQHLTRPQVGDFEVALGGWNQFLKNVLVITPDVADGTTIQ